MITIVNGRLAKELRLAGVSSIAAANAWLPGFITAYNTRFGRDPANAKDLHRPLAQPDDLDEILAWREERTVTRNLTLHYDRMMLLLDPTSLARGLVPQGRADRRARDHRLAERIDPRTKPLGATGSHPRASERRRLQSNLTIALALQGRKPVSLTIRNRRDRRSAGSCQP